MITHGEERDCIERLVGRKARVVCEGGDRWRGGGEEYERVRS